MAEKRCENWKDAWRERLRVRPHVRQGATDFEEEFCAGFQAGQAATNKTITARRRTLYEVREKATEIRHDPGNYLEGWKWDQFMDWLDGELGEKKQ